VRPRLSELVFFVFSIQRKGLFVMDNSNTTNRDNAPGTSGQNPLEDTRTYTVQGKTFVVEPVFKNEAKETVGTILLRLIQSDSEKS
jgi:hypothetical protein